MTAIPSPPSPNFLLALGKADEAPLRQAIGAKGVKTPYEQDVYWREFYDGAVTLDYLETANGPAYCRNVTYFFTNQAVNAEFKGPLPFGLKSHFTPNEVQPLFGECQSHIYVPRQRHLGSWNMDHEQDKAFTISEEMDVFNYQLAERVTLQARFRKRIMIDLAFDLHDLEDDLWGTVNGKAPLTLANFIKVRLKMRFNPRLLILPEPNWNPFSNSKYEAYGRVSRE